MELSTGYKEVLLDDQVIGGRFGRHRNLQAFPRAIGTTGAPSGDSDGIGVPAYNLNVGAMSGDVDISTKVVAGEVGIYGR